MLALLRYGWRIHPRGLLLILGQGLLQAFIPLATAWLLGALTGLLQAGDVSAAGSWLGVLFVLLAVSAVVDSLEEPVFLDLSIRVEADVMGRLARLYLAPRGSTG